MTHRLSYKTWPVGHKKTAGTKSVVSSRCFIQHYPRGPMSILLFRTSPDTVKWNRSLLIRKTGPPPILPECIRTRTTGFSSTLKESYVPCLTRPIFETLGDEKPSSPLLKDVPSTLTSTTWTTHLNMSNSLPGWSTSISHLRHSTFLGLLHSLGLKRIYTRHLARNLFR